MGSASAEGMVYGLAACFALKRTIFFFDGFVSSTKSVGFSQINLVASEGRWGGTPAC